MDRIVRYLYFYLFRPNIRHFRMDIKNFRPDIRQLWPDIRQFSFSFLFSSAKKKKKKSLNIIYADNRIFNRYPEFSDMDTCSKITDNTDTNTNILKNLEYPFRLQAYVQGPCSFQVTVALSINYVVTFG